MSAGDYWPGEAESLLMNMGEEARVAGKKGSKPNRAAKNTKGKRYGSGPATTDTQLMGRLGDTIMGMKADFIVVHMQEPCSFCRTYISDATRYGRALALSNPFPFCINGPSASAQHATHGLVIIYAPSARVCNSV